MVASSLTPIQGRILRALVALQPPWTLTGGGALAGVHLGHRTTRDLDLFWRNRSELGDSVSEARAVLRAEGLETEVLRTFPLFAELRVTDGREVCIVDLVAEPGKPLEPPLHMDVDGVVVAVDSKYEILVNKLGALLGRSELRDLVDIRALMEGGEDLVAALRDASQKDGGFSPLTLGWVLHGFDPRPAARALGWGDAETAGIDAFRKRLIELITAAAAPP